MDDVDAMIATIVKLEGALMFDAGCAPRIEMDNPDVWLCTTQRRFGTFDKPSLAALLGCDERDVRARPAVRRGIAIVTRAARIADLMAFERKARRATAGSETKQ